jgi:hypothetical protein
MVDSSQTEGLGRHFRVGRDGSFGMTGLRVPRARWVACVAASVLPSHVHNQRFRALRLDFKCGDECVLGLDDHMFGFGLQLQSDSELHGHSWLVSIYHGCRAAMEAKRSRQQEARAVRVLG